MIRRKRNFISLFLGILLILGTVSTFGVSYYVGSKLIHPKRIPVTATPAKYHLNYHSILFPSRVDDLMIHGWIIPADSSNGRIVIESHGYGRNRSAFDAALPTADALHKAGFSVIMFDYRAEGNSPGKIVSVGEFETRDLIGAVDYAKKLGYKKIGVIGYSMGAATAIEAAEKDTSILAVIADSPFANLQTYLKKNLSKWSGLPNWPFTPQILWEMKVFHGLDASKVNPAKSLQHWKPRPLLLIAGTADKEIPMSNSVQLYNIVKSDTNDKIWIVKGARHVKAWDVNHNKYDQKITGFFKEYLGG